MHCRSRMTARRQQWRKQTPSRHNLLAWIRGKIRLCHSTRFRAIRVDVLPGLCHIFNISCRRMAPFGSCENLWTEATEQITGHIELVHPKAGYFDLCFVDSIICVAHILPPTSHTPHSVIQELYDGDMYLWLHDVWWHVFTTSQCAVISTSLIPLNILLSNAFTFCCIFSSSKFLRKLHLLFFPIQVFHKIFSVVEHMCVHEFSVWIIELGELHHHCCKWLHSLAVINLITIHNTLGLEHTIINKEEP